MLLKNYDNLLVAHTISDRSYTQGSSNAITINADGRYLTIQSTSGQITQNIALGTTNGGGYSIMSLSEKTICVGNGTQPVQYEDCRLSGSRVVGTFTLVSNSVDYDDVNKQWVRTLTVKCTNEKDDDFVVSEWGIAGNSYMYNSVYSNNSASIYLVWRELLDKPVTIAANSTATLTFTLKVPHEVNAF